VIGNLKPYLSVKDSGVPWLGEVPAHWEVTRIKRVAQINPSKSEAESTLAVNADVTFLPMERVGADGRIDVCEVRPVAGVWNGFTYFRRRDVLVAKITPCFENGKGACLEQLPTSIGFGSTEFIVLRAHSNLMPQFLYRITTVSAFRALGADAMTGAAGQQRVPTDFVSNYLAAIPPRSEQAAIVRVLDHADRQIRRYIRAKQKLIKLLEEQKQAILHHAVTRGLDPNVRLKPSGVEWLGAVPAHWEVRRNGRLFAQRNQTGFRELPILEVSLKTGVRVRDLENKMRKQVMSDPDKYKRAEKGDIAYNMMRMWQGAVGVAPIDGLVSPAYVVAQPRDGVDVRYFSNLFRTSVFMGEVDNCSRGIVKDRNRLYWEDFKQISSPYPPLNEQTQIANAIDESTRNSNDARGRIEREIDLLREYRTRRIADVVTGKLDVRAAAAALPDEVDEPETMDEMQPLDEADAVQAEEKSDSELDYTEANVD